VGFLERRKGLSIGAKLMILGSAFLVIPALGWWHVTQMRNFLTEGQQAAQRLAAEAIATALNNRTDLFTMAGNTTLEIGKDLTIRPLTRRITLDGDPSDWPNAKAPLDQITDETPYDETIGFDLFAGVDETEVYFLLRVVDDVPLFRHPNYRRLDSGDHLRISLQRGADEPVEQYVIVAVEAGPISVYAVDKSWRLPVTGVPVTFIRGAVLAHDRGYDLEFKIPGELVESPQFRIAMAVADVDSITNRNVLSVHPIKGGRRSDFLNLRLLRSPELERILGGLTLADSRIWIVDAKGQVRAEGGAKIMADHSPLVEERNEQVVADALAGVIQVDTRPSLDHRRQIIMAAAPITAVDRSVIGAVLVERSTESILALERVAAERAFLVTMVAFLLVATGVAGFSWRLTWRIHRLRNEAEQAIDAAGRLVATGQISADANATDEIGDLSRSFSTLIGRVRRYRGFLETLPRTLRHELHNPLNTVSVSLQNVRTGMEPNGASLIKYVDAADRGVARIREIVERLTEAASVEEALSCEPSGPVDLALLLPRYVENIATAHREILIRFFAGTEKAVVTCSDYRIEQLMDKLIDNGLDFTPPGGEILVLLHQSGDQITLSVENDGPLLGERAADHAFDSLFTQRQPEQKSTRDKVNLGLGLYLVRLIAENSGGTVAIANRSGNTGVVVTATFPTI
jgi:signal transduction histidine kinase